VPPQYRGPDTDSRLAALRAVADEVGVTPHQVVIAWLLQGVPSTIPIIGGSTPAQVRENLAAADVHLSEEQLDRLGRAGEREPER
jgi:aryl-alcohol dehydrogenase-like predicted oxidoreductase